MGGCDRLRVLCKRRGTDAAWKVHWGGVAWEEVSVWE